MTIVYILIIIVVLVIYVKFPRWLRLVLFLINVIVPDPIPYLDEIAMGLLLIPSPSNR